MDIEVQDVRRPFPDKCIAKGNLLTVDETSDGGMWLILDSGYQVALSPEAVTRIKGG